jgi:hypothetical protein
MLNRYKIHTEIEKIVNKNRTLLMNFVLNNLLDNQTNLENELTSSVIQPLINSYKNVEVWSIGIHDISIETDMNETERINYYVNLYFTRIKNNLLNGLYRLHYVKNEKNVRLYDLLKKYIKEYKVK